MTTLIKGVIWVVEKVGKWVVRTVCKIVGAILGFIRDFFSGLWGILAGIFTLDGSRILDGIIQIVAGIIDAFLVHPASAYLLDENGCCKTVE